VGSVGVALSTVRCPPWQLEEGDGGEGVGWRPRRPACGSHGSDRPSGSSRR
jgi:hypothetical protein